MLYLAVHVRCSVGIGVRMHLSLTLIGLLRTPVALGRPRPLHFTSFMRVHSLRVLPDSANVTLRLGATRAATTSTNRKAVMLLHIHVHVTLVQAEFAAVV